MTLSSFLPGEAERLTVCCACPLALVVVWEEPVTWAVALRVEMIRPVIARLASEAALLLGNQFFGDQTLGKKKRMFIRYQPHPPRAKRALQAVYYSKRSGQICAGEAARASFKNSRALCSVLPGAKIAEPATSMSAPASTTRATVS